MHIEWHDTNENGTRTIIMRVGMIPMGVFYEVPIRSWFRTVGYRYKPYFFPNIIEMALKVALSQGFIDDRNIDDMMDFTDNLVQAYYQSLTWEPEKETPQSEVVEGQPPVEKVEADKTELST